MTLVETGTVEAVALPSIEETVTALAAVIEIHGPEHPLVSPSNENNLLGALKGYVEPEFTDENAAVIVGALREVASGDIDPLRQSTAQWMLENANSEAAKPVEPTPVLEPITEKRTETKKQPVPRSQPLVANNELVDGHIELNGFEELVTALRAVEAFAGARREQVAITLEKTISKIDPFDPKPRAYFGEVGKSIFSSLIEAAERDETVYDETARHMLGAIVLNPPADETIVTV